MVKRVAVIVIDGLGIGEMKDAAAYGDTGANTFGNVVKEMHPDLPNLMDMGLYNAAGLPDAIEDPLGCFGKMAEKSPGKDTTTGHWEIAGLKLQTPFPTYPNGFPQEIIEQFCEESGHEIIGNIPASGTEIIERLGSEHLRTGKLIVYTSADSVFQIAAHEEIIPLQEQYRLCEIARGILVGPYAVGRVIARPFVGRLGAFTRTGNRRDFSVVPPSDTVLDVLSRHGYDVAGVGKIEDIFAHRGLTKSDHASGNAACIVSTLKMMDEPLNGLLFVNLVDFDMVYGHRNDIEGFARGLEAVDRAMPDIMRKMGPNDLLLITADHGCDPGFPGTDHTRELVPLLCWTPGLTPVDLGIRHTYADIAATILDMFGLENTLTGTSFYSNLHKGD